MINCAPWFKLCSGLVIVVPSISAVCVSSFACASFRGASARTGMDKCGKDTGLSSSLSFSGLNGNPHYLVDVGRGAYLLFSSYVGLNHNKQTCKMIPNNNQDYTLKSYKAKRMAGSHQGKYQFRSKKQAHTFRERNQSLPHVHKHQVSLHTSTRSSGRAVRIGVPFLQ